MIFADRFEALKNVLEACVFLGASLTVNTHHQGAIEAVKLQSGDTYEIRINGTSWAQLAGWECGYSNGKPFVRLGATIDYFAVPEGREIGVIDLEVKEPTDYCGNRIQKGVFCP